MDKKYIRFINSNYDTLFFVPDGGKIQVNVFDGSKLQFDCKYIDPYHVEISNNIYHICQFAEFMEKNGNTYEPLQEIGDLDFYEKRYLDPENIGPNGKVPYYVLLSSKTDRLDTFITYCDFPTSPEKTFCMYKVNPNNYRIFSKTFSNDPSSFDLTDSQLKKVYGIVKAIQKEKGLNIPSLDDTIKAASQMVSSQGKGSKETEQHIDL